MDWKKWIMSGLKQIAYLVAGAAVTVVIGALTAALGYKPQPGLEEWIWTNGGYGAIVTLIALLKNWWQHRTAA